MRRLVFILGLAGILGFSSWMIYLASRPRGNDSMLALTGPEPREKDNGSEIHVPDPTFRPPESNIIGDLGPIHEWEKDPIIATKEELQDAEIFFLKMKLEASEKYGKGLEKIIDDMQKPQQTVFIPSNNNDAAQWKIATALEDQNDLIREQQRYELPEHDFFRQYENQQMIDVQRERNNLMFRDLYFNPNDY